MKSLLNNFNNKFIAKTLPFIKNIGRPIFPAAYEFIDLLYVRNDELLRY